MDDLREKVIQGLGHCAQMNGENCGKCPYQNESIGSAPTCTAHLAADTLSVLEAQNDVIKDLLKVGYPHNFQREEPWIRNYMYAITDVIRKAVRLNNGE